MKACAIRLCRFLASATYCHLVLLLVCLGTAAHAQPIEAWRRTIGTPAANDLASGITFDETGTVYLCGFSSGAFVAKYDTLGNQAWIRQIGSSGGVDARGISADNLGNIYVTGDTQVAMSGPLIGGVLDAFIVKYNSAGSQQWVRQFGTIHNDIGWEVSTDGLGNAYVGGQTGSPTFPNRDATLAKYDTAGNQLWFKQAGSAEDDVAFGVSAREQTNVYLTGYVAPDIFLGIDVQDYYLTKYDSSGNVVWNRQLGTTSSEQASSVFADGLGNIYVSGATSGLLGDTQYGADDAFVSKFNAAGDLLWTHQFGTSLREGASEVAVDQNGNVFVVGNILSPPAGTITEIDPFVTKLDSNGNVLWNYQITGIQLESIFDVAIDNAGALYLAGNTKSSVTGTTDGLLIKIVEIPEPSTAILGLLMTAGVAQRRLRRA
jgi:hypothetical protein